MKVCDVTAKMANNCFCQGLMEALQLNDRLEIVRIEIECLRKGFEGETNFWMTNLRLTTEERKIKDIDNYVRNLGSNTSDSNLRENIWDSLNKIEEEMELLKLEIRNCPSAYEVYFYNFRAMHEIN